MEGEEAGNGDVKRREGRLTDNGTPYMGKIEGMSAC